MSTPDPTQPPIGVAPPAAPVVPAAPPPGTPEPTIYKTIQVPDDFDFARWKGTVETQRASEAQAKADAAAAVAAQKAAEEELERVRALVNPEPPQEVAPEITEARKELREARLLVNLAKPEHALIDAEAAARLITGVVYDEAGNPTNLDERIAALKTERPFLLATPLTPAVPPAPGINPGGGHQPGPALILTVEEAQQAQQAGMDPAYFAQLKELGKSPDQFGDWQALRAQRKAPPA